MLTFDKVIQTPLGSYVKGFCLTSDELPPNGIANGSIIEQLDPATGVVNTFRFDGENQVWTKIVSDGAPQGVLPTVAVGDNGDVLTVVEGVWSKAAPSGGDSSSGGAGMVMLEPPDASTGELEVSYNDVAALLSQGLVPFFLDEYEEDGSTVTGVEICEMLVIENGSYTAVFGSSLGRTGYTSASDDEPLTMESLGGGGGFTGT